MRWSGRFIIKVDNRKIEQCVNVCYLSFSHAVVTVLEVLDINNSENIKHIINLNVLMVILVLHLQ